VHKNERTELRGRGPDRLELGIVEVLAGDVGADLRAAQAEHVHGMAQLVGGELRRLHGQRGDAEKAVGTRLGKLGNLLVLNAGECRGDCLRLRIDERLRAHGEHLHVYLGRRHVLQAPVQVPAAARKMPVDAAGHVEGTELIVDVRELGRHLGRLALQQPDRLFRQDMRVNVDRL
jgi:hypothetical protein